jgi:glycine/D-amino acid oxidase-like deaminating enzyme
LTGSPGSQQVPITVSISPGFIIRPFPRRKAVSLGIRYLKDRAVDFEVAGKRVAAVRLESGKRIAPDSVVNAANCWGPESCERVGMKIPWFAGDYAVTRVLASHCRDRCRVNGTR